MARAGGASGACSRQGRGQNLGVWDDENSCLVMALSRHIFHRDGISVSGSCANTGLGLRLASHRIPLETPVLRSKIKGGIKALRGDVT